VGTEQTKEQAELQRLEQEGEIGADYLEELLDIADLDGDIDIDVENRRPVVAVISDDPLKHDLDRLVGRGGETLEALQELVRLAVETKTGDRTRLMLDVAGYRARRRQEAEKIASQAIEQVRAQSAPVELQPMNPFERKIVHDAVARAGLTSKSAGVDPERYVVISQGQ
jgi:spoIIIJ-associated protein